MQQLPQEQMNEGKKKYRFAVYLTGIVIRNP